MKNTVRTTAGAALLAPVAVAVAVTGALVAPAGHAQAADSAQVTIGLLEAQGFDVRLDRVGSAPLDRCTVTSVRNPQEHTRLVRVDGRGGSDRLIEVVDRRSITVSLDCSR
ncbi:hypothetical protein BH09ACT8_BH09ACT8_31960 [soil metagenome]